MVGPAPPAAGRREERAWGASYPSVQHLLCLYTMKLAGVVVVLRSFQQKSKWGIAPPQHEIDLTASACAWRRNGMKVGGSNVLERELRQQGAPEARS